MFINGPLIKTLKRYYYRFRGVDFLRRNIVHPKPEVIFWWLEPICNLRCNHCDIGKKTLLAKFRPALSLKEKKAVIRTISKWMAQPYSLTFIAGEPFLHQDMFEILTYASGHQAITSLTSNGTLISLPNRAEEVVKSGLSYIALSLDSYNSEIHDWSRGRAGVRDQVMDAVRYLKLSKKKLKRKKPLIYINSIIMKGNAEELKQLIRWVKKEKLDGITFQPIASTDFFAGDGHAGERWFENSPLWPSKQESLRFVDTLEKMKKQGYPIQHSENDFTRFRAYFSDPIGFSEIETCQAELKSLLITHDGYIKMCPNSHEHFGHVFRDDLDEMWNSKSAYKARQHVYECQTQAKILAINKEDFYF